MARKNNLPGASAGTPSPYVIEEPPLKRQSGYSTTPWKPGEIPGGSLMKLNRPFDDKGGYRDALAVEPPTRRGNGYPKADE